MPDTIAHQHFSGQKNNNLMLEYSIRWIINANWQKAQTYLGQWKERYDSSTTFLQIDWNNIWL